MQCFQEGPHAFSHFRVVIDELKQTSASAADATRNRPFHFPADATFIRHCLYFYCICTHVVVPCPVTKLLSSGHASARITPPLNCWENIYLGNLFLETAIFRWLYGDKGE